MISLGHVVIGLDFRWLAGGKAVFIGGISAEKKPSSPPCKVEFACCAVLLEDLSAARFLSTKAFQSGFSLIAFSQAFFLSGCAAGLSSGLRCGYTAQHLQGKCGDFVFALHGQCQISK